MVPRRLYYREFSWTVQKLVLLSFGDEHGFRGTGAVSYGFGIRHTFRGGRLTHAEIRGQRDRIQRWGGKNGSGCDALALLFSRSGGEHQFWLWPRRKNSPPGFLYLLGCMRLPR